MRSNGIMKVSNPLTDEDGLGPFAAVPVSTHAPPVSWTHLAFKGVLRKGVGEHRCISTPFYSQPSEDSAHSKMGQRVIDEPTLGSFQGQVRPPEGTFLPQAETGILINVTSFTPHVSLQVTLHYPHFTQEEAEARRGKMAHLRSEKRVGPPSPFPVPTEHIQGMWAEPPAGVLISPPFSGSPIHRKFGSTASCHVPADEIAMPPPPFSVPPQPSPAPRRQTGFLYSGDTIGGQR